MKTLKGKVTSTKMNSTAVVTVERRWQHPLYKKTIKRSKKYLAHDELQVEVGDHVLMQESPPLSKRKRWKIIERFKKTRTKAGVAKKKKTK
jgi:small subunit ribosomal protein S17